MYADEDMLMLSGLQHYVFCARQWGLIHITQSWQDNHLTFEGQWMHRHVDNPFEMGSINGEVHLNSVSLVSHELGVYGVADLLKLTRDDAGENTIVVPRYPGRWSVCPVEFKHGRSKTDDSDRVQLCAQAMCLEEMYGITITMGLFIMVRRDIRSSSLLIVNCRRRCGRCVCRCMTSWIKVRFHRPPMSLNADHAHWETSA